MGENDIAPNLAQAPEDDQRPEHLEGLPEVDGIVAGRHRPPDDRLREVGERADDGEDDDEEREAAGGEQLFDGGSDRR